MKMSKEDFALFIEDFYDSRREEIREEGIQIAGAIQEHDPVLAAKFKVMTDSMDDICEYVVKRYPQIQSTEEDTTDSK